MSEAPREIIDLAERRQVARAARDFQLADLLRDQIATAGWVLADTADGFQLAEKPPFHVYVTLADALIDPPPVGREGCGVGLIVDGWPEDVRTCLTALLEFAPKEVRIIVLDLGNVDDAGLVAHEISLEQQDRVHVIHVGQSLEQVGWGRACGALIELDPAAAHVVMDLSSVLTGDAITPLLAALAEPGVVAVGWRGTNVDIADWRSVVDAGPGEVDVLLGYLLIVDGAAARATLPSPKAKFYRNGDLEWSLLLRAAGGRLVVPTGALPVEQARHRGYHDSDPELRDRESKKNYDRLLQQFRGRVEILAPRSS
ncbi:MAG: hypothetical protein O2943_03940 [Actinomycetota bacterium]|nr:hypothetical protein [Actinomycetota bacterium]